MHLDHCRSRTPRTTLRAAAPALALMLCLAAGSLLADQGPQPHADGKYDAAKGTYLVAPGDDLFSISKRLGVPAETIKADNAMTSDQVNAGATLKVTATKTHAGAHQKPLATMSCEDFVGLDETFQPKAVYWAAAYGKNGQPEAEAIGVEGVERVVPFVIEACKKAPKETFWQKVKAELKKLD